MSSWGNNDNAANAPYWAVNSTIAPNNPTHAEPTAVNVALLYGNTTPDVYTTDETIGLFGIDANEAQVEHGTIHTGWVIRKTGSGGRAGRVQEEVLVALSSIIGDGDTVYANTTVTITAQPASNSSIHGAGNTVTFTVAATSDPSFPVTYVWQFNSGSVWANASTDTVNFLSGYTGTTLTANAVATTANTWKVRAVATALNQTATTANAVITIL